MNQALYAHMNNKRKMKNKKTKKQNNNNKKKILKKKIKKIKAKLDRIIINFSHLGRKTPLCYQLFLVPGYQEHPFLEIFT
jgi:hypothetical protein